MELTELIANILAKAKTDKIYENQITTVLEELEDINLKRLMNITISDLLEVDDEFDISDLMYRSDEVNTLLKMSSKDQNNLMTIYDIYDSSDIEDISNGEFTFDCDLGLESSEKDQTLEDYFFNKNLSILAKLVTNQELEELVEQKQIEKKQVW